MEIGLSKSFSLSNRFSLVAEAAIGKGRNNPLNVEANNSIIQSFSNNSSRSKFDLFNAQSNTFVSVSTGRRNYGEFNLNVNYSISPRFSVSVGSGIRNYFDGFGGQLDEQSEAVFPDINEDITENDFDNTRYTSIKDNIILGKFSLNYDVTSNLALALGFRYQFGHISTEDFFLISVGDASTTTGVTLTPARLDNSLKYLETRVLYNF